MSLFENDNYRWRETYFVLFHQEHRPSATEIRNALESLGPRFQVREVRADSNDQLESLTLLSPDDFAAMDISFVAGEEVEEQIRELLEQLPLGQLTKEEKQKWKQLKTCNARFDVYHFEQVVLGDEEEEEDGFLDPGALLIVLQRLAKLCKGIGLDPQSGTVV